METSRRHTGQYELTGLALPLKTTISSVSTVISALLFVRFFLTRFVPDESSTGCARESFPVQSAQCLVPSGCTVFRREINPPS
jgi:hypothetical protein